MTLEPLKIARIKVSSVLNDDTKLYGKQALLDGSEETCWNSAPGPNQYLMVRLKAGPVGSIALQFQGGFGAARCTFGPASEDASSYWTFYPKDTNGMQTFEAPTGTRESGAEDWVLWFHDLTDSFGRVILYRVKFYPLT